MGVKYGKSKKYWLWRRSAKTSTREKVINEIITETLI
jgi:hypothetical protein